jgi:hypothetical protein
VSWSGRAELKAQLLRLWDRGELLREALGGSTRFPLRLSLKTPTSSDITDHFAAVRAWTADLAAIDGLHIEWQELRHRVQGVQRLPASVRVESLDDALAWIGKRREWERFSAQVLATRQTLPSLLPWLERRPLQALGLHAEWPGLLAVVAWIQANPRPGIHTRQVDLPGVHSKFIETHRGVLGELLDLALPADAVAADQTGIARFGARYGFLEKPVRIRFRVLDPAVQTLPGIRCPDISLDAASFSRAVLAVKRVFITENETNFLAFPPVRDAIVIFGAGYGWDALAGSQWLRQCALYYWGDIDTHGFAILDQLRAHFPQVASLLMDHETLQAHASSWGVEHKPTRVELQRLTAPERALYDDLRDNRIRNGLRLEQEHVGFRWVLERLGRLPQASTEDRLAVDPHGST